MAAFELRCEDRKVGRVGVQKIFLKFHRSSIEVPLALNLTDSENPVRRSLAPLIAALRAESLPLPRGNGLRVPRIRRTCDSRHHGTVLESCVKLICATVLLAAATHVVAAQPIPQARAASIVVHQAPASQAPPGLELSAGPTLLSAHAIASPLPPIEGPGECGAPDLVRLQAVLLPDGSTVTVNPAATLRRTMAEAVVGWVRADVARAVEGLGARLGSIESYDSYSCRGRNNVVGAKLSEHAKANALDIHALKLTNGKVMLPTDPLIASDVREALRKSACERFYTVLGPGSDGSHEDHVHVDLLDRPPRHFRLCQWNVRKPEEATQAVAQAPMPKESGGPLSAGSSNRLVRMRNAKTMRDQTAARRRSVTETKRAVARGS
jgi:hypothetical protein